MLRDTILQTGFSSFLASLLFWVEPPLEKPDIRHWSDSLQEAAPQFADFEAFMSEVPLDVSLDELKEASTQRRERLSRLDEAMDGELSQGQGFRFQRERISLLQEEMSYRRFKSTTRCTRNQATGELWIWIAPSSTKKTTNCQT